MNILDRLERRLGRLAIPRVTILIVAGQVLFYTLGLSDPTIVPRMALVPARVLEGEYWRLLLFVFMPPATNVLFAFFAFYMFFLMGSALEGQWGAFRYNVFLLVGYLATVGASFLSPSSAATPIFIGGSVFLAFAHLYPEFQIYLFFILPVKIKWLALLTWVGYLLQLIVGSWPLRALVAASLCNYLLFFGRDILAKARGGRRHMANQARRVAAPASQPFHTCAVCGINDQIDRQMEFRYCTQCRPATCYCRDHIANHAHRVAEAQEARKAV